MYHCICLYVSQLIKLPRPGSRTELDFYKYSKALVVMSKHPFYPLFIDVLSQIVQIYKFEQLEISKKSVWEKNKHNFNSMDVSFST